MSWFELRRGGASSVRWRGFSRAGGAGTESPPAWRTGVLGAVGGAAALALTAVLAYKVTRIAHVDSDAVAGFWLLQHPKSMQVAYTITNSVNTAQGVLVAAGLCILAWHTGQRRLIVPMVVLLAGANVSTQVLKGILPGHSVLFQGQHIITVPSFPSGHATAAMSLALCMVMVTPCRARALIAWIGALYALAVGYSVLVLTNHFPSDVIGGYLMAAAWAMLAVGLARALGHDRAGRARGKRSLPSTRAQLLPLGGLFALACVAGAFVATTPKQTSPVLMGATVALVAAVALCTVAAVELQ